MKTFFILVLILINTNIFSQTLQNSGTNANLEAVFFIDQTTGWAVGSGGTIISTTNAGENWHSKKIEDVYGLSDVFFITKNLGWAVGRKGNYPNFTGVLLKTENGGETWEKINYSSSSSLINIRFINDSIGWMTESSGNILKSYDSGFTWQIQYSGNIDQGLCVINEQIIWVNGRGANMLKTTNGGKDWDNIAINNSHWWDIFFIDENMGWVAGDDGIKKTTDSGKNWLICYPDDKRFYGIYFIDKNNGIAILQGRDGIIKTNDGGMTWENIYKVSGSPKSLNDIYIYDMANAWIVGSGGLIVKCSIKTGTSIKNDNKDSIIPERIELQQNYPNPFNPSTIIKYNLGKPNNVILKIYNLSGQELETLVNGFQTAGVHLITWQPNGLPSGIYFYRLQAGGFSEKKKLIIQK